MDVFSPKVLMQRLAKTLIALGSLLFGVAQATVFLETVSGHNGPMVVQIEIDGGAVSSIQVLSHKETQGIGTRAIESIPKLIAKAGKTTGIDAVTGASVSSHAIFTAVEKAIAESKGLKTVRFRPGTYSSRVYGNNGYLNVEVTVNEDSITAIRVPGHSETRLMGGMAIQRLTQTILKHQTLNVDSVSGASVTSSALKKAVAEAIEKAGASPALLQKPVPQEKKRVHGITTLSYDLVIVGSGGAGLSAATAASETGQFSVVVLEKMPVIGGNTLRCASAYNTADPLRQSTIPMTKPLHDTVQRAINEMPVSDEHRQLMADVRAKYIAYLESGSTTLFDCPEWHALQTYNGGDKVGQIPQIRKHASNVLTTLHWLQSYGSPVMNEVSQGAGALWQRTHQFDADAGNGLVEPLLAATQRNGVQILTEMRATELAMKNGRVTGLEAIDSNGNRFHFNSRYGVILATGGYSQNPVMRQKSVPYLTPDMVSTNQPGATGDGIVMATKVGADLTGMNYIQVYPLATPGSGALQGRARKMSGMDNVIDVNQFGQRFINEDARRDTFVAAIKKQPNVICYDINDSSIVEEYNSFGEHVETLIEIGRIFKSDTLEGLEKQLRFPPGSLTKTVAEFNDMVRAKYDHRFGRKLFDRPIEKPPFYATPRAPSIHHTMGGVRITPNAQVLNVNGSVIPGLFAAGEVTGGVHGSNRLGGNATADAVTFGRIAAKTALGLQ